MNIGSFAVYLLLRGFVVLTLILQLLNGNFENVFLCLLTLLLLILPAAVQVEFRIKLPPLLEVILLVFIFCAEILERSMRFMSGSHCGIRCIR
ncbi:MAG: hypothetical protein V8T10_05990 [Merdibacter sp.]